jgi:uncharacterized protein YciI
MSSDIFQHRRFRSGAGISVFLVLSTYTGSPEAIARVLPEHRNWVGELYERQIFVLSGRLKPPTGGFMLARGIGRAELESLLVTDPFRRDDLLTHAILELTPTRWSTALASLAEDA